jgi:site-specific recombinase XerD
MSELRRGGESHATPSGQRQRRAEPISKRTARNGAVSYEFRADVGVTPDGSRDRRRFTYRTLAEARRELRRITSEVAAGTYARRTSLTVGQACDEWLAGRRGIRQVTMEGYRNDLKPVRLHLGGRKIQALTKADGDSLVEWMLTEGRRSPKHHRSGSLMSRIVELVDQHPEGITAAEIKSEFPEHDVHTCLSGLKRAGRIAQPRRAVYAPVPHVASEVAARGVKPVTVRSTLTTFRMVVQSFVDQGVLPRNVIALVERPADPITSGETDQGTAKSWAIAEADQFREAVREERLFACWLLSCYGLRRSEVLGLRWSQFDGETLRVRRSRVAAARDKTADLRESVRTRLRRK